jgi:hypothetical protein
MLFLVALVDTQVPQQFLHVQQAHHQMSQVVLLAVDLTVLGVVVKMVLNLEQGLA